MRNQLQTYKHTLKATVLFSTISLSVLTGCNTSNDPVYTDPLIPTTAERFQSFLDTATTDGLPGVALTVQSKEVNYSGVSGVTDLQSGEPLSLDNRFYIASIGKTFHAVAMVQLASEGLMNLNDGINRWLPDVITSHIPSSENRTVLMLLNHTTGIQDFQNDMEEWYDDFLKNPDREWNNADILPYIMDRSLHFEPGTDYRYSNTNYVLAALIAEVASGELI